MSNTLKKALALALALTMVFALAACGGSATTAPAATAAPAATPAPVEQVYLTITKNPTKGKWQWIYTAMTRAKERIHAKDDFYFN